MLHKVQDLKGFHINASDGDIGTVHDLYFEDDTWVARYLIVDTGGWLSGQQVLITPLSIESVDVDSKSVHLGLTKEQIESSPGIGSDEPVSRQFEQSYFDYYQYPYYWYGGYPYMWGGYVSPTALARSAAMAGGDRQAAREKLQGDRHLRSVRAVKGHHIHATDGSIGNVEDFVVDDETWRVHYLLVDTSDWWFGKHVVIPTTLVKDVNWIERTVSVGVSREEIKDSPGLEEVSSLDRDYENRLHDHYNKQPYWSQR